jgi:hypothetical protein
MSQTNTAGLTRLVIGFWPSRKRVLVRGDRPAEDQYPSTSIYYSSDSWLQRDAAFAGISSCRHAYHVCGPPDEAVRCLSRICPDNQSLDFWTSGAVGRLKNSLTLLPHAAVVAVNLFDQATSHNAIKH